MKTKAQVKLQHRPSARRRASRLIHGDARQVLRTLKSESVDALVTDPPAGIGFMGLDFDHNRGGREPWVAWLASITRECYRILKPGHYGLVWALPRTAHWTALALEESGFEIRDVVVHLFGSGWPKSRASLKPASEHWILVRKPGPIRPLNIDVARVPTTPRPRFAPSDRWSTKCVYGPKRGSRQVGMTTLGRWPANLVLSHHDDCSDAACVDRCPVPELPRYFYVSKRFKREGNDHPTVKSVELMRYLIRLITPPGGRVLDPFAGSGTTCVACIEDAFAFIGVERDAHYIDIANRRIRRALGGYAR